MSDVCAFIVGLMIFLIPIILIVLIISLVKKKNVKKVFLCLCGCLIGIVVFSLIGTYSWTKTKEDNEKAKKEIEELMDIKETAFDETIIKQLEEVEENPTSEDIIVESEVVTIKQEDELKEIAETFYDENKEELIEEEYKEICREIYYDNIFSDELSLGEKVKIHFFIAEKYKFFATDIIGIMVEDIAKQYNLSNEYIGACAMHEETKDNILPSYFGKQFYLMFSEDSELSIDNYKTGQYFIVYGDVIKTDSGIFVLPKYIEEE